MRTKNKTPKVEPKIPVDHEAELFLIGCLLTEPSLVKFTANHVKAGDLWNEPARLTYQAVLDAVEAVPEDTNHDVVLTELRRAGAFERVGGYAWLQSCVDRVVDTGDAVYYAKKVRSAANRRLVLDATDRANRAAAAGEDYTGALGELIKVMAEVGPKSKATFDFRTASEFDGLDLRRSYHVENVLAAGPVPTIISGSFKTLKTSIVMDLLISLAGGWRFLGHFPTRQTNVAVMSGESGGFALQNMARRIAFSKGCSLAGVGDGFRICTGVPSLAVAEEMKAVERFIRDHDIGVFVIDPVYLAMRGMRADDAGNLFSVAEYLKPLADVGQATGCTMVLVHHNSRGATRANVNEPAELADIAWSGFAEWAGQWICISRREKYDPDSNGEHRLWFTAGGRDGHSITVGVNITEGRQEDPDGRRWEVVVEQASKARNEASEAERERREQARATQTAKLNERYRDAILDVMRDLRGEAETMKTIRNRAGLSGTRFEPVFAALQREGIIIEAEVIKMNRPYQGFKLNRDTNGTATGQHRSVPAGDGDRDTTP